MKYRATRIQKNRATRILEIQSCTDTGNAGLQRYRKNRTTRIQEIQGHKDKEIQSYKDTGNTELYKDA